MIEKYEGPSIWFVLTLIAYAALIGWIGWRFMWALIQTW